MYDNVNEIITEPQEKSHPPYEFKEEVLNKNLI